MKVIFTNRFFYPDHAATSQLLSDLAFHLARQGREVHVVTSRQRYDAPNAVLPALEKINGVQVHRVWTSRFGRTHLVGRALDYLTFYTSAFWRLWRLARQGDIIVAKTDPPLISVVAAGVCRLRDVRLVNWLQDVFPEVAAKLGVKIMAGRLGGGVRRLRNASLRAAAMNVALGERMAGYLKEQGVPAGRIAVIHNWAEGRVQPVAAGNNPLRTQWGLMDRLVVGYSGNMGRAHEFETILGAAALLERGFCCFPPREEGRGGNLGGIVLPPRPSSAKEKKPDAFNGQQEKEENQKEVVFLFIGGGHYRFWLEQEVRRRNLNNVLFQPYQPQERLAESLSVPDVHLISLSPSMEGLIVPSKFYGIAAAGRPVLFVGDSLGEIPRIIRAADCGAAVGVGEREALAGWIIRLSRSEELRSRWGNNARNLLQERFDRAIALKAWEDKVLAIKS